jgi:hypothetical protein
MTELGQVRFGTTTIDYRVVRSRRRKKTIEISIDHGEGVLVAAPWATPPGAIRDVVLRRAGWIVQRASQQLLEPAQRGFVSGESLLYLGREVRLIVVAAEAMHVSIRFDHWQFRVSVSAHLDGEERRFAIERAFQRWYRRRAGERLREAVGLWSPLLGATPSKVLVRDQRKRWGSCSPDGSLRFNWRIVMAAPAIIEYVAVHELAHLLHRNHSTAYWAEVERLMPDFKNRRAELKKVGPRLHL